MTTESEPHIIQADAPFNVAAVRTKTGRIDALAKRARLTEAPEDPAPLPQSPVDPSRRLTDTRVRIATDDGLADENDVTSEEAAASAAATDPVQPSTAKQVLSEAAAETLEASAEQASAQAPASGEPSPESLPLSELQRRMLDIKSNNQTLSRELEALEDSLRQSASGT